MLKRHGADIVFVDVQLPDGDGFALAKDIQAISQAGIIFVTRRDTEVDRILGLEMAGDHYVTKPINLRDLLARARSLRYGDAPSSRKLQAPPPPWCSADG